jgi:hypothetical protein
MINTKGLRVWTERGWLFAEDLSIGDTTISFNPTRNCCEYDTIESINLEYTQCGGYAVVKNTMRQIVTSDHPILIWNDNKKQLTRIPISKRFMGSANLVLARSFEPYLSTQDIEEIKWSARVAASFSNHKWAPVDHWDIVRNLGGYESQVWLDTFFHWNVLLPAVNWMKSVKLRNTDVRDMLFHIVPRAGRGLFAGIRMKLLTANMTIRENAFVNSYAGWSMKPIDGIVFNISTKNGNFLARKSGNTFIMACDYK